MPRHRPSTPSAVGLLMVLLMAAACGSSSTALGPAAPGTYSLRVRLLDKSHPVLYSGPATFTTTGNTTVITCWTDPSESTPRVELSAQGPVTVGTFGATNNRVAPSDFLVTDMVNSPMAQKGGSVTVTTVTASMVDGSFNYSGDSRELKGNFAAAMK